MTVEAFTPAPPQVIAGLGPYPVAHPYQSAGELIVQAVQGMNLATLGPSSYAVEPARAPIGTGAITLGAAAAAAYAGWSLLVTRATRAEQGWSGVTARERGMENQLDRIVHVQQDMGVRIGELEWQPIVLAETRAAADRAEAAALLLDPVWQFMSVVQLRAHDFAASPPDAVRVLGYDAPGDGGAWTWRRVDGPTLYNVHEQSADGSYWTPERAFQFPGAVLGFGTGAPTGATNLSAFRRGMRLLNSWGGGVFGIGPGIHPMSQTVQENLAAVAGITIRGAGRGATTLQRSGGPLTGSYIVFRGCSDVTVEDLTVDGARPLFIDSAHALHFAECTRWAVRRVHITGFDASALSVISTDGGAAYVNSDFEIRDVSIDGRGVGRNGILVNNAADFSISGITGGNLDMSGVAGSPSVGIGIKTNSIRGRIFDCSMNLVRRGCNLGAEGGVSQCRAWGLYFSNAVSGIASFEAADCHFSDVTLRTPYAEGENAPNFAGGQVAMRDATRCTATGIAVRGGSNVYPIVYQRNTTNCFIELSVWDNGPAETKVMTTVDTVTALRLDINQYQGPGIADATTLLTTSADTTGLQFFWRGNRVLPAA